MKNKYLVLESLLSVSLLIFLVLLIRFSGLDTEQYLLQRTANDSYMTEFRIDDNPALFSGISNPELAKIFYLPRPEINTPEETESLPQNTIAAPAPGYANWIKPLGIIRDAQYIERIYLKDTNTNRILKVRTDKTEENGSCLLEINDTSYLVKIDGQLFQIPIRK